MLNLPLVTMLFVGVNLDFFVILLFLLQKYRFKDTLMGDWPPRLDSDIYGYQG